MLVFFFNFRFLVNRTFVYIRLLNVRSQSGVQVVGRSVSRSISLSQRVYCQCKNSFLTPVGHCFSFILSFERKTSLSNDALHSHDRMNILCFLDLHALYTVQNVRCNLLLLFMIQKMNKKLTKWHALCKLSQEIHLWIKFFFAFFSLLFISAFFHSVSIYGSRMTLGKWRRRETRKTIIIRTNV